MGFLMQIILLLFWETSIHYQVDKLRFHERWWLYSHLKRYLVELDLVTRVKAHRRCHFTKTFPLFSSTSLLWLIYQWDLQKRRATLSNNLNMSVWGQKFGQYWFGLSSFSIHPEIVITDVDNCRKDSQVIFWGGWKCSIFSPRPMT